MSSSVNWTPNSLYDYFDQYADVAMTKTSALRLLDPAAQITILNEVRATLVERARSLEEEPFVTIAISMAEDLYQLGASLSDVDSALAGYVLAVWGTYFHVASERGYRLRYLIDNHWPDVDRAERVLGALTHVAGFECIVVNAEAEAPMALTLTVQALAKSRHVLYLDTRGVDHVLDDALSLLRHEGDIVIERHEAPGPNSHAHATVTPRLHVPHLMV